MPPRAGLDRAAVARAFADAYAGYDVIAGRWPVYGYAFPFVELLLGAAYLSGLQPTLTNAVTVAVMSVGTVGVVRTLVAGRRVQCACLGAVFNLPIDLMLPRSRPPAPDWWFLASFLGFYALFDAALMATMAWLFNVRWRMDA